MTAVTRLLDAAAAGDAKAAADLLPLVYGELRKLAAARLAAETPGQTLQATALVHEAYLRLVGPDPGRPWNGRGHFFAAAAEAMRRILVENARRKRAEKHGGGRTRINLADAEPVTRAEPDDLIELDAALDALAQEDPAAADVAKLRLFAGLPVEDAAEALGVSRAKAYRDWTYARAWLHARLRDEPPADAAAPSDIS